MQVNRPKEYRPELADASKPQSKEEQMRQQLGLGPDDVGPGDEEDEAPPAPARRGGGGGAAGGAEKRVADLEAKNAELEKKLASEGTRRDEQVETIKKLANSRMANITKSFEEKLAAKERELEELRHTSSILTFYSKYTSALTFQNLCQRHLGRRRRAASTAASARHRTRGPAQEGGCAASRCAQ